MKQMPCSLCLDTVKTIEHCVLFSNDRWRVVDADDPAFPGFTRVIWQDHIREMTDLSPQSRQELMGVTFEVEAIMRDVLSPDKVNLACLGNQVPHLHWHIIPRWQDDSAFPQPVWSPATQTVEAAKASKIRQARVTRCLPEYHQALINRLKQLFP